MVYLIYGIMKNPVSDGSAVTGVKGKEVSFVDGHGLCAAVSEMPVEEDAPPVSELLAYGKVVEHLHRLQAVIPMRYGCFQEGIPEIQRILGERKIQRHALLEDLAGHDEMGIRLLLPEFEAAPRREEQPANGRDYLSRRKAHYLMGFETSHGRRMLLDRYIQAFSGLYSQRRTETATKNGAVVLSIYFLVPRNKVGLFKENFRRVMEKETAKAMLSGPWPPYNFAAADLAPANPASQSTSGEGLRLDA